MKTDTDWAHPLVKQEAQELWDSMTSAERVVLLQLRQVRWDGYISSKSGRDSLIHAGLAVRYDGFATLTLYGLRLLHALGKLASLMSGHLTPDGRWQQNAHSPSNTTEVL
jgi:hypothetical protein